ncbi:hypothetical protein FACS189425_05950 [Clostridia bacterium]|nr:hypothetical protein FACS189425_05950 [Clostridia bacterium]
MNYKRLVSAIFVMFLIIPLVAGCSTNQTNLNAAFAKTYAVSSLKSNFNARIMIGDMAVISAEGTALYSDGKASAKFKATVLDEMDNFEEYVDFAEVKDDLPAILGNFNWAEKSKSLYTTKITSEEFDALNLIEGMPEALGEGGVQLSVALKNGYVDKVEFSIDISTLTGVNDAIIQGVFTLYDFNVPVSVNPSDKNSINIAEYLDDSSIQVYLRGKKLKFPKDSLPFEMEGRTLVPARFIVESLGGEMDYEWDGHFENITARLKDRVIYMVVGSQYAYVDGETVTLDVPAMVVEDRTRLPLRFVSENFGADVSYYYKDVFGREVLVINID